MITGVIWQKRGTLRGRHVTMVREPDGYVRYHDNYGDYSNKLRYATRMKEGHVSLMDTVDPYMYYLDAKGNMSGLFIAAYPYSEGRGLVVSDSLEDGAPTYAYLDKNMRLVSDGYKMAHSFKNGHAVVKEKKDELFFYIDRNFKKSPVGFEQAGDFEDGWAMVKHNGRYMFIDDNYTLSKDSYKDAIDVSCGYAVVKCDDGLWHFRDKEGNISEDGYSYARKFSCGYAVVYNEQGYFYRSLKGALIGPFEMADDFRDEFGLVETEGKFKFMSSDATFSEAYDVAEPYDEGIAKVYVNGKQYYRDMMGRLIDEPTLFSEQFYEFYKGYCNVDELSDYIFFGEKGYYDGIVKILEQRYQDNPKELEYYMHYIMNRLAKEEPEQEMDLPAWFITEDEDERQ